MDNPLERRSRLPHPGEHRIAPTTDGEQMLVLRTHLLASVIVAAGLVAAAASLTVLRPSPHTASEPPPPPHADLPYTKVVYDADQARRAFASVGITLIQRGSGRHRALPAPIPPPAPIVDLSTANLVVEVDAFGAPAEVQASGFSDYIWFLNGHWLKTPANCVSGAPDAERWQANVRVIVDCRRAGDAASGWLERVSRALARLSRPTVSDRASD